MDAPRSMRGPHRVLPTLTPAPSSSRSSASAPHKSEHHQTRQPIHRSGDAHCHAAQSIKKPSSFGHIFFNRRPLDLIRRTTSSLLHNDTNLPLTAVFPTLPAVEERKFWQSHRLHDKKNGSRRLQKLQRKRTSEDERKRLQWRLQTDEAIGIPETKRRNRLERESRPKSTSEFRKRPTPCPPTGDRLLLDLERAADLTTLERSEIQQYDEVYFVSSLSIKQSRRNGKIHNDMPVRGNDMAVHGDELNELPLQLFNDGYDDEHGDYLVLMRDHLAFRYEVLNALGQGSFGQVVRCLDHRTRQQVAIKIIRNRPKYRDQALTEVQLLAQLHRGAAACEENPHIVHMEDYFEFRHHVCIVFEILGMNLYDNLMMRNFRGLSMCNVRTVGKQLAQALSFLKQQNVIHCDLKPENVLLNTFSLTGDVRNADPVENVTLIDFGSSCMEGAHLFTYIQSRFYRCPEVLLGYTYTGAMDMWSFACILVELHTGHPIFPGENEQEQFACIMEVLNVPPVDIIQMSKRHHKFFDEVADPANVDAGNYVPKSFVNSHGRRRVPGSRSLASAVMTDDSDFVAFLRKCFVWDPKRRLTPEQALEEPWLKNKE